MRRAILLLSLSMASAAAGDCLLPPRDEAFIQKAIVRWERVRVRALGLSRGKLPRFVFFDERCTWGAFDVHGTAHGEMLTLPDGEEIPARLMTFAGTYGSDRKPYIVMALESVWRADERHRNNPQLEALMQVVFVHEMTHTVQASASGKRLDAIESKLKLELDDDLVQKRFASKEGFTAAYEHERDLLFAVAAEKDVKKRHDLARRAWHAIQERRARFFVGDDVIYGELEDIFLGMEGIAQWAAYRAARDRDATREEAITLVRGSRKWWSQDEGLALFLAIEALMPGFQARVFSSRPVPAWALFEEAVRER